MNRIAPSIAIAAIAITSLAGCASMGSTAASGQPSASAGAPSATALAAPSPSPSAAPCTSKACIISDAKSTLIGGTAKDESVMTKLSCRSSTVKKVTASVWTVHCTAGYSDSSVAEGIASVNLGTSYVSWEPTDIISDGS
jgi:hypothetical protein